MISSFLLARRIRRLRVGFRPGASRSRPRQQLREPILRSELFSAEQMDVYGAALASAHRSGPCSPGNWLLQRLAANEALLARSCELLTRAHGADRAITPAAEWLLDNYYLIEEQIRTAHRHLPKGYSRELPRLLNGANAQRPRVYDIAIETISHGDGRIDRERLGRFVASYQRVTELTLGELWAIPIMLRLALIENLRRIAASVLADWDERNLAGQWAERMVEVAERDPKNVVLTLADMARSAPPMASSFVAELTRRLQGQGPALALPLNWVEQHLAESGLGIERLVQLEAQQQAADQVSIGNSIASLRLLATVDWREFVESASAVERVLRDDPAAVYAEMDFATRDDYRHVVERLARNSARSEVEVAQSALALARQPAAGAAGSQGHVGFYLVGHGLPLLQRHLGARPGYRDAWQQRLTRFPLRFYFGAITLLTLGICGPLLHRLAHTGIPTHWRLLLAVAGVMAAGQLAISLVNWLASIVLKPQMLPRMDYSKGVPVHKRSLVVVPCMFSRLQDVDELIEGLEVRFLANRDEYLHFALLTDFGDAPAEVMADDAAILARAQHGIERLNAIHGDARGERFFLFHRPRRWNPLERVWMGHERKRGKLADLNALLLGGRTDRFCLIVGRLDVLEEVKYVITLDVDTQLPRGSARQFIGAMAHPLNQPRYDPEKGRVVAGYAILQPRVGISLPSAARSSYARLFGSDAGIDPYTRTVSDVYQDLFGEGSFIGKGIYDLQAFERAIDDRFPDNRILSHDLIEGCYARSGLISDLQLYEEYTSRYSADVTRRHRWIRGDWQLLPWLWPRVPRKDRTGPVHLSLLSRWKIFDNLRRSLMPVVLQGLLLTAWLVLSPLLPWTMLVVAVLLLPGLLAAVLTLLRKPRDLPFGQHLRLCLQATGQQLLRVGLTLAWLPHEALYSLDAVIRTLWRMAISHRHRLQWNASRETERTSTASLAGHYRLMWIAPGLALALLPALALQRPAALTVAAPVLLLWLLAPALAWWVGRPSGRAEFAPSAIELRFLRALARKTWGFFEAHVGPQDNWLPPDNVQEQPARIAHRTSPTNMGLALLANLAAYDFGYLTAQRLLHRTAPALQTMLQLPRHRGHFYNWYDTLTLQPLPPHYISTVDSGNLAGHLLTLRAGLLALVDEPVFDPRLLDGLDDTVQVLRTACAAQAIDTGGLAALQRELDQARAAPPLTPEAAQVCLPRLQRLSAAVAAAHTGEADDEAGFWISALAAQCDDARTYLAGFSVASAAGEPAVGGFATLRQLAARPLQPVATALVQEITGLAAQLAAMAVMEYGFLYDPLAELLTIGYNLEERRLDNGHYDLLASEARLASFVAIAQEQLPQETWFMLRRLLTTTGGEPVLLSWTGSMFEYLMPLLVMPGYEDSLLDQTCHAAVARQIEYGSQRGVPWGISESMYNIMDIHLNYQYRAFGVPGLGLKRGLEEELVVAPYASALALMVAPGPACANLQRLAAEGLEGRFGLYEAVDYTPARLPRGQRAVVLRAFMAHHQGMSLLALDYLLRQQPMQRRFQTDPHLRATLLLLQERMPRTAVKYLHATGNPAGATANAEATLRIFTDPDRSRPAVQLLSNGHYHVMVSSAGGGYSRCGELAVTRWQEDLSRDDWGLFCYLRDVASGQCWSATHQPLLQPVEHYEAAFSDARAEFRVRHQDYDAHTEIVVSSEDDIELRRVRLTNRSRVARTIEITSYAEVVLAPAIADALHPAFSKLFVQTELIPELQAIVCTRRPRSGADPAPWMCHLMAVHEADVQQISYETDRARFIGRGRSVADPVVLQAGAGGEGRLSDSHGAVLDPIVAIRCRITLQPEQSALVDMVTGVADSRQACLHLIAKYRDRHLAERVVDLAWTHSQVMLRQLNASHADAQLYELMAASILYANAAVRADAAILRANRRGQSALWGQAISGDLPIVLLHISTPAHVPLARQLVQAHAYWRLKGLAVDLVVLIEDHAGYRQQLQDMVMGLISSGVEASLVNRAGGIFVVPAQQIASEDRILVQTVARLVLTGNGGSLAEQAARRPLRLYPAQLAVSGTPERELPPPAPAPLPLLLEGPYGGFSADGSEYIITLAAGHATPAPWANVLANPQFGSVVSESGSAYTWGENAHEFRLTPWANDPVTDASGEALYLRDEHSGRYWSPTPLPCRGQGSYRIRHGFGYSVFEHQQDGVGSSVWMYVAQDLPVKFIVLKVRNDSARRRRLSATGYVEWVLGDLRARMGMYVVTETDPLTGALLARNAYNTEFPDRVAFFDVDDPGRSLSGNRTEFLGRNGSTRAPAAMANARLSGQVGAGLDPCAALQVPFELEPGEEHEVVFRLGVAADARAAVELLQRCRGPGTAAAALEAVRLHWQWVLGRVQVHTPDPAVDVLVNGWLMYQTIACRFLARSGYYQSGGAIGFRDQLQDAMAMVHAAPYRVRQHLLLCAEHQFLEGDVQHWWHPPLERGVRTRCSDDYLWLPLAVSRYVTTSGDQAVLDEPAGYLEGRPLNAGEESYYDLSARTELREPLYRHCVRAIEHAAARGVHGLPLIGSGDWNDGMNLVGEHGRGESVWLGFFLRHVLLQFAPLARRYGDAGFAGYCEAEAATLKKNLQRHGWDGHWYRRAYFDDGTPLGSAGNAECRIDSIAQSWSVLSDAGDDGRQQQAMAALLQHLVDEDSGLVRLLTPPFDRSLPAPGYIQGYVPGVRENGGQYTQAAIWAAMAFAARGDGPRAWQLLRLLEPTRHGRSDAAAGIYQLEPYVVAADVYAAERHVGRGGWSWYTGSAGWMYRLLLESLLGVQVQGAQLRIAPLLPPEWPSFTVDYRYGGTDYHITVIRADAPADGVQPLDAGAPITLVDDGRDHSLQVRCAPPS
ncbi:glycoside hydrolase family 94 protein [Stenotrophomonas sp. YIM B06876]|uniref:GH36-type glycosyl hydrolase domain-containing protein n=1 Tax=Stenotrophomonas sp. YIM B06876 TaxID=3060211 RepID=UPI00273A14DC|nr:glycoside hydrolase family 94 protein [Stenotrophomonas sp. YIM B06876]